MRNIYFRHIKYILIIISILFISCREDIVQPTEYATNPNEPVQINEQNSYTFLLNAVNLTIDVTDNARFSSFTSRITISIIDHTSGFIKVSVVDKESISRFNYTGDSEDRLFSEALIGYIPGKIGIQASNFTGKLRIQLTRTF